jgi:hypothetical protein
MDFLTYMDFLKLGVRGWVSSKAPLEEVGNLVMFYLRIVDMMTSQDPTAACHAPTYLDLFTVLGDLSINELDMKREDYFQLVGVLKSQIDIECATNQNSVSSPAQQHLLAKNLTPYSPSKDLVGAGSSLPKTHTSLYSAPNPSLPEASPASRNRPAADIVPAGTPILRDKARRY